jgi:WhiB family redox-sensing transcriptional regulator
LPTKEVIAMATKMITKRNWRQWAKCHGLEDPDLFYPLGAGEEGAAKEFCRGCPALEFCLAEEMARPPKDQWGVWGGTTADERKAMLRARNRAAANHTQPARVAV